MAVLGQAVLFGLAAESSRHRIEKTLSRRAGNSDAVAHFLSQRVLRISSSADRVVLWVRFVAKADHYPLELND